MNVNPYYSTNPSINPSGVAFGTPAPENYPEERSRTVRTPVPPCTRPVPTATSCRPGRCASQDWSPYLLNMRVAALDTGAANDGAKTTFDPTQTPDLAWTANGPQITGNYFVMSITDSASAARYGLQTASLSPAGDDTPRPDVRRSRPRPASWPASRPWCRPRCRAWCRPIPSSTGTGAYPLTMLTYAATTPETLNASSRAATTRRSCATRPGPGRSSGTNPDSSPTGTCRCRLRCRPRPWPRQPPSSTPRPRRRPRSCPAPERATRPRAADRDRRVGPAGTPRRVAPARDRARARARPGRSTGRRARPGSSHPSALSAIRTEGFAIGLLRWALPFLLAVGLAAGLGAVAMNRTRTAEDAGRRR